MLILARRVSRLSVRWQAHRGCCEPEDPKGPRASLGSRGPEGPEGKSNVIDSHVRSEARSPQVPLKTHLGKVLASVHYMFSE